MKGSHVFRKTLTALCSVGAAAAVAVAAPGAASASLTSGLWINGDLAIENPEVNRCYVVHVDQEDYLDNDTAYKVTFYYDSYCKKPAFWGGSGASGKAPTNANSAKWTYAD
jgi:hypothetical protein